MGEKLHNTGFVAPEIGNDLCLRERHASYPPRFTVPASLVSWQVEYPGYTPEFYDAPRAETPAAKAGDYADPASPGHIVWNRRQSFSGPLAFDTEGYPLNPAGRTGLWGRGILNAWGPTLAAEAIVTRTTTDNQVELLTVTRTDNGKVAMPAGKFAVNSHNEVIETKEEVASRELLEETGIQLDFGDAREVYRGYVDDERNTDNAWMETVGLHKHLPYAIAACLIFKAEESEVSQVGWTVVSDQMLNNMHASSGYIVRKALER
jgi:ADP-ribose pyrophosphatase